MADRTEWIIKICLTTEWNQKLKNFEKKSRKSWNYFLHKLWANYIVQISCITTQRAFAVRDQERHFMVYLLYLFYLIELIDSIWLVLHGNSITLFFGMG